MKTGDKGKFFKFEDGQVAPIVNRDDLDDKNESKLYHIHGWGSISRLPQTKDNLISKVLNPDKIYRVLKGIDDDGIKYLLQEKI